MRIRELNLIRYGKFTDRPVTLPRNTQDARDIHFIVGPNEAGKSTLRAAIGDWLFGIPPRTSQAFLHPMPELRIGGELEREGERLAFHRIKGNKNTLLSPGGQPLADNVLAPWLGGLEAAAFQRMHALDHASLVEGGAGILSASNDLGQLLFQSAAGLEQLGKVLQALHNEAETLWGPRKSASRAYYMALDTFEQAQTELKQTRLRSRDWKTQHEALGESERRLQTAGEQHTRLQGQLKRLQRIRRVRPLLDALVQLETQLATLQAEGSIPRLPDDAGQILDQARQELALAQHAQERHQAAVDEAQAAMAAISPEPALLALAADIRELNERRLQYRAWRTDILKRQEEVRLEEQRVKALAAALQWPQTRLADIARRLPAQAMRARLQRLLKSQELLQNQHQQTHAAQHRQQQILATHHAELTALPKEENEAGTGSAVEQALTQALSLGDETLWQEAHDRQCRQIAEELAKALASLGRWPATPDMLATMTPPEPARIQQILDDRRHDQGEERRLQELLSTRQIEIERGRLELEQLVRTFHPVSRAEVQAARAERDARWQTIRQQPSHFSALADEFGPAMLQADRLADERTDRLQHDAERHARSLRLEVAGQEIQGLQALWQTAADRLRAGEAAWAALLDAGGLPALPLELATAWLSHRRAVLDLAGQQRELDQHRETRERAVLAARLALWQARPTDAPALPSPPPLATCLQAAREYQRQTEQTRARRQLLEKQLQEVQIEAAALDQAARAAQTAWADWEAQWQDALAMAGYPATTFADRIEAELDVLAQIEQLLEKIRTLQTERIDRMQADLDALAEATRCLSERIGTPLNDTPPEVFIQTLEQRLAAAERARAEWQQWQTRRAQAQEGLDQARQQQARIQARLSPLLAQAGTEELDALGIAIGRARQQDALENRREQLVAELANTGDGLNREALAAELAGQEMPQVLEEMARLEQHSGILLEEISALGKQHGAQKSAFGQLSGEADAARAETRKQEAIARMAQAVEQYWETHVAARLLRWSMDRFRETRQGPLLARASASFNTLTLQSFSRLLVDGEAASPRLTGVREDGRQVDVAGMSEGSRDQLYLALRLAALELQLDQGIVVPLIADDLFINFDDARTAAGFRVLGELSRRTQIIFLTHHDHLIPLARQILGDELNVVML